MSVIIPTYNRGHLVRRAVQSALWQTHGELEVLVVDDASQDDTAEVVGRIPDPRVHYLRHETNRGLAAARNTGIRHANGEYLAFLDDDDIWLPEKLEKQVRYFQDSDETLGAVHCGFLQWQAAPPYEAYVPMPPWSLAGDALMTLLRGKGYALPSALVVPAAVIEEVGAFDETFVRAEDADLIIRIAARYRFGFVPETLVIYSDTPDSLIKSHALVLDMRRRLLQRHKGLFGSCPNVYAEQMAGLAQHYLNRGEAGIAAALIDDALTRDPGNAWARQVSWKIRYRTLWRLGKRVKALGQALVNRQA